MLSTLAIGININLTLKSLGKILNIPSHSVTLNEIEMDDEKVFSRIYLLGQGPPMANSKLQPIPRLIGRILAYNICVKMGSYNYYSHDLATCVYVIMAKFKVNCNRIMFDTLVKKPPIFLPYGVFLAHIFRKFKLDLPFESNVIKVFEPFDKSVLLCMKLFETPLPQPTFPSQSSHRASQSTFTQSTDVLYNSLSAEMLDIKARQTSMMESQTSIINNQGLILDRFLNLNIRMDHMDKTQ